MSVTCVLEEILRSTLEWSARVMEAEAGSILLWDPSADELVIKVATGPKRQEVLNKRFQKGKGVAGWVVETGEPRLVPDVRQDAHFFDGIDRTTGFKTRSILAAPLQMKGETLGVLEILNKQVGRYFDDQDLKLFMNFADLVTSIIDTAGAFQWVKADHRCLRPRFELERVMIGQSSAMQKVFQQIEHVAGREVTVLLRGETGTGKGLVARIIHDRSPRREKPFLTVDCGAMSEGLWESELFGYKKGAFTGAIQDRQGLFEAANGGTLFLDEIGNTPLALQTRLLHVLQEGEIRRVGETQTRRVDMRVIAATNRELEQAVRAGAFREDLFFRLNVVPIVLPPLRERTEDLPILINDFIEKSNRELGGRVEGVCPEAMRALLAYPWPGNIRELENVIKRMIVRIDEGNIRLEHLPPEIRLMTSGEEMEFFDEPLPAPPEPTDHTLEGMERSHIVWALDEAKGNQSQAARLLGVSREKLRYRMRKYGMKSGGVVHQTQAGWCITHNGERFAVSNEPI